MEKEKTSDFVLMIPGAEQSSGANHRKHASIAESSLWDSRGREENVSAQALSSVRRTDSRFGKKLSISGDDWPIRFWRSKIDKPGSGGDGSRERPNNRRGWLYDCGWSEHIRDSRVVLPEPLTPIRMR